VDGGWSGELVVYETMVQLPWMTTEVDVVPGVDYSVEAVCFIDHQEGDGATRVETTRSSPVSFEVTAGGSAPPRDDPPSSPIVQGLQPQAQSATPVAAQPTYTG
jgi:hypothetical protein